MVYTSLSFTKYNVFLSDGANICKTENMKHHLVAHPYSCSKYIDCSGPDNTFVTDDYVSNYQSGNVYNPDNGWSDTPGNVDCAKQNGELRCHHIFEKLYLFHVLSLTIA